MAKIDTLFMSKTAEKTLPFGAAHTYIAHIREYPPPPAGFRLSSTLKRPKTLNRIEGLWVFFRHRF